MARSSVLARVGREMRRWVRGRGTPLPPRGQRVRLDVDPLEVHTLVCAAHVPMALWSLKSLVAFTGLRPRVVVHDDGTLTAADRRLFARHFEGLVVLDDRTMRARMARELEPWPACLQARQEPAFYCSRKLLDVLFVAEADAVLYVDSDILFFREPTALLEHVTAGRPCFGSDYQDAYAVSCDRLTRWAGFPVEPRVNAGLLHIPVAAYRERLDLIERFLAWSGGVAQHDDMNRDEQTAHALLMSTLGAARLPPTYALSGDVGPETVSFHFVNDGVQRKRFWRVGVPRIRRAVRERLDRLRTRG